MRSPRSTLWSCLVLLLMAAPIALPALAVLVFLGMIPINTPIKCDHYVLGRVPSPDGRWIAETNLEGCWMDARVYVTVHPADEVQNKTDRIVVLEWADQFDAIIHWANARILTVGVPLTSDVTVAKPHVGDVDVELTYFPQDAESIKKRSELSGGKITRQEWFDFLDARLARLTDKLPAVVYPNLHAVAYSVSEMRDSLGGKWCAIVLDGEDGIILDAIELRLMAYVDKRDIASFELRFSLREPLDERVKRRELTTAQFTGTHFSNNPTRVNRGGTAIDAWFISKEGFVNFLQSFETKPFEIAFVFDLPETVVAYRVDKLPDRKIIDSFFHCVGNAKALGSRVSDFAARERPRPVE
jgi:hypothetical protein